MEQRIEPKILMLAAENIRKHGTRHDGSYTYQQISMELSYDGYTVILKDHKVTLTLFFHNKVKVDYRRVGDLEDFYERLKKLAKSDS